MIKLQQLAHALALRHHGHFHRAAKLHHWRDVADQVLARSIDLGVAEISELKTIARLRVELIGQHEVILFCRRGHPLQGRDGADSPSPWLRLEYGFIYLEDRMLSPAAEVLNDELGDAISNGHRRP